MQKFKTATLLLSFSLFSFILSGCAELDGFGPPGGGYNSYSDPYYAPPRRGYDSDWRNERDRREIERERDRLDRERRELDRNRWQQNNSYTPPAPRQERCPSGYSPSEQKCSSEERRRGCSDMRLPGGLGCVRR